MVVRFCYPKMSVLLSAFVCKRQGFTFHFVVEVLAQFIIHDVAET